MISKLRQPYIIYKISSNFTDFSGVTTGMIITSITSHGREAFAFKQCKILQRNPNDSLASSLRWQREIKNMIEENLRRTKLNEEGLMVCVSVWERGVKSK